MIVETTDLQLRSLVLEEENKVMIFILWCFLRQLLRNLYLFMCMFLILVFFDFQAEEVAVAKNLLAMAVGIKQKKVVDDIVKKVGDYTCLIHDAAWIFILV